MELIRRLRYIGYLEHVGIAERDPGEVIEKLMDHLAAKREWYLVEAKKKPATRKAAKKSAEEILEKEIVRAA